MSTTSAELFSVETSVPWIGRAAQAAGAAAALVGSIFAFGTAAPQTQPRPASVRTVVADQFGTEINLSAGTSSPLLTSNAKIESAGTEIESLADRVIALHSMSGLTWDQLARLFNVSRRAVHNWASGARLNSANAELLMRISGVIMSGSIGNDPEATRHWLLMSRDGGRSIYDELRSRADRRAPLGELVTLREKLGLAE